MSPFLHYFTESVANNGRRVTSIPLMKFISSIDLTDNADANNQAEQPAQPGSSLSDPELWSK